VWENQLGYRGIIEVWELKGTKVALHIDVDEDVEDEGCWFVTFETETINRDIGYGTFAQCDTLAKEFMRTYTGVEDARSPRQQSVL
jgi:nuclear transport factor 2 (NTF2) superfamily protein